MPYAALGCVSRSAVEDARSKARRQQEQRATKIVEESKSARKRRSGSR